MMDTANSLLSVTEGDNILLFHFRKSEIQEVNMRLEMEITPCFIISICGVNTGLISCS